MVAAQYHKQIGYHCSLPLLVKVYDILLSEYEYLSLSEIMSRDLCRGQSERRVEAAVKKLLIDKRIISAVIDGIECYAPSDMDGIR